MKPTVDESNNHDRDGFVASRRSVLVTSTPGINPLPSARDSVTHPALNQLGPRAGRYVHQMETRRRVALTRRSTTALLIFGVLASGPTLALSGGPDAAATRAPRTNAIKIASATSLRLRQPNPARIRVEHFVAVSPASMTTTSTIATTATRSRFVGADARSQSRHRWISYPASRFHPFLVCTRGFESDTAGGYRAVSRDGLHFGAYQFKPSTWNTVARHVGRYELVGVMPSTANPLDQDWMALYLYEWLGASHWEGRCAGK